MEKGFYTKPNVDEALEHLFYDANSNICGEMFLHGVCGIFALALHDTYGYKIGWILDDEEDDEYYEDSNPWYHLVHIFCYQEEDNGEIVFVDIRGCQTDEIKFENGFEDFFVEPNYFFGLSYDDVKNNIYMDMSEKEFNEFYEAAIHFIKKGNDIYKIKKIVEG